MSKEVLLMEAVGHMDEKHLEAYLADRRPKKWARWAVAIAACLCLAVTVFAFFRPYGRANYGVTKIYYNGNEFWLCGWDGEREILRRCGLPDYLHGDLSGKQLGYLKENREGNYEFTEKKTNAVLYEYSLLPNENVYILRLGDDYYAAVRWKNGHYVDIYGKEFSMSGDIDRDPLYE